MTLRFAPDGDISGGSEALRSSVERREGTGEAVGHVTADSRAKALTVFCPRHIASTVARLEAEGDPENVGAYLRYVQMVRSAHHVSSVLSQAGN